MLSKDYIDFMKRMDVSEERSEKILNAAENADLSGDMHTNEVSGVERYRRPKWSGRLGAFAAALAVVIAIGGGAAAVRGLRGGHDAAEVAENVDLEYTEENPDRPAEDDPAETDEPFDNAEIMGNDGAVSGYPENTYDMSTKEGIVAKMLNSVDFYDRASGMCVRLQCHHTLYSPDDDEYIVAGMTDFSYSTVSGEFRTKTVSRHLTNTVAELADGALPEGEEGVQFGSADVYCDGDTMYHIAPEGWDGEYDVLDQDMNEYPGWSSKRDGEPVNAAMALDKTAEMLRMNRDDDYEDGFIPPYNVQRHGCPISFEITEPILKCLNDFGTWDFANDTYCGRDVLNITGKITEVNVAYFDDKHDPSGCDFMMYVDTETGMILKYVEYNTDGTIYDLYIVHDIRFNDDAEPIEAFDPTGMRRASYKDFMDGVIDN